MNAKVLTLTALAILLASSLCIIAEYDSDDSDATNRSFSVTAGSSFSRTYTATTTASSNYATPIYVSSSDSNVSVSGSASHSGSTLSFTYTISGSFSTAGTRTVTIEWRTLDYEKGGNVGGTDTITITVNAATSTYYARLYFNANNGSGAPSTQSASMTGTSASGSTTFTISSAIPTRDGYTFLGWSTSSAATSASYQPGGTISVSYGSSKTLYAVWQQATITMSGSPGTSAVVGTSYSYSPTLNVTGYTLSVSGADWLSISSGSIIGTPTAAGTYNITLTTSKTNYTSASQSFSITVYSALEFTSSPTNGAIAYAI